MVSFRSAALTGHLGTEGNRPFLGRNAHGVPRAGYVWLHGSGFSADDYSVITGGADPVVEQTFGSAGAFNVSPIASTPAHLVRVREHYAALLAGKTSSKKMPGLQTAHVCMRTGKDEFDIPGTGDPFRGDWADLVNNFYLINIQELYHVGNGMADNREFNVTIQDGLPMVDWTGLFEEKKMEGFAKIDLDLPEDGYVSLNIKNAEGQIVRHLLTANFLTKGKHELFWDGLTNMSHMQPGEVVPAGDYTWEAIYHTGIGLRLVGWAHNAGKAQPTATGMAATRGKLFLSYGHKDNWKKEVQVSGDTLFVLDGVSPSVASSVPCQFEYSPLAASRR